MDSADLIDQLTGQRAPRQLGLSNFPTTLSLARRPQDGYGAQPDCFADDFDDTLALEGLGKVGHGSIGQTLFAQRWLIMGGHENDGDADPRLGELTLDVAPREARHLVIEQNALWPSQPQGI
jgi:hypothetical protein